MSSEDSPKAVCRCRPNRLASDPPDRLTCRSPPPLGPRTRLAMSVLDRFRLDGRAALVTGGSRGLGRAMAEALASAGAIVAISARTGFGSSAGARRPTRAGGLRRPGSPGRAGATAGRSGAAAGRSARGRCRRRRTAGPRRNRAGRPGTVPGRARGAGRGPARGAGRRAKALESAILPKGPRRGPRADPGPTPGRRPPRASGRGRAGGPRGRASRSGERVDSSSLASPPDRLRRVASTTPDGRPPRRCPRGPMVCLSDFRRARQ